jgi:hypothetical protein
MKAEESPGKHVRGFILDPNGSTIGTGGAHTGTLHDEMEEMWWSQDDDACQLNNVSSGIGAEAMFGLWQMAPVPMRECVVPRRLWTPFPVIPSLVDFSSMGFVLHTGTNHTRNGRPDPVFQRHEPNYRTPGGWPRWGRLTFGSHSRQREPSASGTMASRTANPEAGLGVGLQT